jgi:hypothetical protein
MPFTAITVVALTMNGHSEKRYLGSPLLALERRFASNGLVLSNIDSG